MFEDFIIVTVIQQETREDALEVKHFSNGTSNVKMGPQIFQWGKRERREKDI